MSGKKLKRKEDCTPEEIMEIVEKNQNKRFDISIKDSKDGNGVGIKTDSAGFVNNLQNILFEHTKRVSEREGLFAGEGTTLKKDLEDHVKVSGKNPVDAILDFLCE